MGCAASLTGVAEAPKEPSPLLRAFTSPQVFANSETLTFLEDVGALKATRMLAKALIRHYADDLSKVRAHTHSGMKRACRMHENSIHW